MWLVYAAAFVLGAGILLIQVLSAGDGHDFDGGDDFHLAGEHHPAEAPGLLSTRSLSYGVFAFGFVGGAMHALGLASPGVGLALALASAAATTLAVGVTFRRLADPAVSGEAGLHEALGATARVIVACASGRTGKVRVSLKGQAVDMLAETGEEEIPVGAEVVITDVRDTVAQVICVRGKEESA
jgi:membrane protein implicated in regulation of membrane protease activity